MLSKLRSHRPGHATVVAYLALFVALGGSSYAAVKITGKNVKDSSLTGKDLKNNSIAGVDVKNGSLLAGDFKSGQLPAGPQGPAGPKGEQGLRGNDGAPGSAAGYAHIDQNGGAAPSLAKNVDRTTHVNFAGPPSPGAYCVHFTFPPNNVVATLQPTNTGVGGEIAVTNYVTGSIHCINASDPGYNVTINTYNSAGTPEDRSFDIAAN